MAQLTTGIHYVAWVGEDLYLPTAPFIGSVAGIRQVNVSGQGEVTFLPSANPNFAPFLTLQSNSFYWIKLSFPLNDERFSIIPRPSVIFAAQGAVLPADAYGNATNRVGGFYHSLLSETTGTADTWEVTTTWHDGSPMTPQKVDNILYNYNEEADEYLRLVIDPLIGIEAERFGINRLNSAASNSAAFTQALSSLGEHVNLIFKAGTYNFAFGLVFANVSASLLGAIGRRTRFTFPASTIGVHAYTTNRTARFFAAHNIVLVALGVNALDGSYPADNTTFPSMVSGTTMPSGLSAKEQMVFKARQRRYHGFSIQVPHNIQDCEALTFSGHQLYIHGNLERDSTNASGSNITFCKFTADSTTVNAGCGYFIDGPDANGCIFFRVDVRDNPQAGGLDSSFLGNHHHINLAHNNLWGHFFITEDAAEGSINHSYLEGGVPDCTINSRSMAIGGTRGTAIIGGYNQAGQSSLGAQYFGKLGLKPDQLLLFDNNSDTALSLSPRTTNSLPAAHWGISTLGQEGNIDALSIAATNSIIKVRNSFPLGDRRATQTVVALDSPIINGITELKTQGFSVQNGNPIPQFWDIYSFLRPADTISHGNPTDQSPTSWVCVKGGYSYPLAYAEGLTGTVSGSAPKTIVLSGATYFFEKDSWITIGGVSTMVTGISNDRLSVFVLDNLPTTTAGTITVPTAKLKPMGRGVGLSTQRPTLRPDDVGFPFFSTDLATSTAAATTTWSGTAWV